MIITQELVRFGARGYGDGKKSVDRCFIRISDQLDLGLLGGMVIGLPPVRVFIDYAPS